MTIVRSLLSYLNDMLCNISNTQWKNKYSNKKTPFLTLYTNSKLTQLLIFPRNLNG